MSANKSGFIQNVLSSGLAVRLGILIGQRMPRRVGYGLAAIIARMIVRYKTGSYWTVSSNLRHVVGPQVDDATLHKMVHQVFVRAGRVYYDFYHAANWPRERLAYAVRVPEIYLDLMKERVAKGEGVLVLGLHMGNFDLAMVTIATRTGLPIQVLTLANPRAGYRVQDHVRAVAGIEVTPITPESLRLALRRLQSGWIVFTGADRPVSDEPEMVEFFQSPAYLATGPARIALRTGATVLVASSHYEPEAGYVVEFTGPVEMMRTGDRKENVRANARRLAEVFETHIRAHPQEWLMFHPVWPGPAVGPNAAGR